MRRQRKWTIREILFLRRNYHKLTGREIARMLDTSTCAVYSAANYYNISKQPRRRKSGEVWEALNGGRPIIWIRPRGERNNRYRFARYTWEKHNGKIPKGKVIVFKDGNPRNCDIKNLLCLTRGEVINNRHKGEEYEKYRRSKPKAYRPGSQTNRVSRKAGGSASKPDCKYSAIAAKASR